MPPRKPHHNAPPPGDRIAAVTVTALGGRGDGIASHNGRPVFIPGALPGEGVQVRLGDDRGEGYPGRLLAVTTPSPDRVPPPCPYYESCGGCSLQHWADDAYRAWTMERVRALMTKNGLAPRTYADPVFVPAGTRRRATLAALLTGGVLRLGYHRARSHSVTDIPSCLVLTPALNALVEKLRVFLPPLLTDGRAVDVFVQDTGAALDVMLTGPVGARRVPDLPVREAMATLVQACGIARLSWRLRERDAPEIMIAATPVIKAAGDLFVPLPPGAFMQPSAAGEAALIAAVTAPLAGRTGLRLADLFAGCGTFSGPLLAHGTVLAVESDGPAIEALGHAARAVAGLRVEKRNLFTEPLSAKTLSALDVIVFDPPRAGAKEQAAQIAQSDCPLVIAVSCNPATFARDAALLCAGGYEFAVLHVVDQFTWSAHIELVGVFTR